MLICELHKSCVRAKNGTCDHGKLHDRIAHKAGEGCNRSFCFDADMLVKCELIEDVRVTICLVCLGRQSDEKPTMVCPFCGRVFHETCAKRVGNCPMCGANITPDPLCPKDPIAGAF